MQRRVRPPPAFQIAAAPARIYGPDWRAVAKDFEAENKLLKQENKFLRDKLDKIEKNKGNRTSADTIYYADMRPDYNQPKGEGKRDDGGHQAGKI